MGAEARRVRTTHLSLAPRADRAACVRPACHGGPFAPMARGLGEVGRPHRETSEDALARCRAQKP